MEACLFGISEVSCSAGLPLLLFGFSSNLVVVDCWMTDSFKTERSAGIWLDLEYSFYFWSNLDQLVLKIRLVHRRCLRRRRQSALFNLQPVWNLARLRGRIVGCS